MQTVKEEIASLLEQLGTAEKMVGYALDYRFIIRESEPQPLLHVKTASGRVLLPLETPVYAALNNNMSIVYGRNKYDDLVSEAFPLTQMQPVYNKL